MNTLDVPLGELARTVPGATAVFRYFDLDFCCGGQLTLREAAAKRNIDPKIVAAELERVPSGAVADNTADLSNEALTELILTRYHDLHRQQLPELIRLAARVELVHGGRPDCPAGLANELENLRKDLEEHMRKEEQILFPMITRGMTGAAVQPVAVMRRDHDDHGAALATIEKLTGGITPPAHACNTWRALYTGLQAFREDLMDHIHLENNILFNRIDGLIEDTNHG